LFVNSVENSFIADSKIMFLHYLLGWIPMMLIGIMNGTLREITYGKYLDELRAHQVSTVTGVVLLGLYIWGLIHLLGVESPMQAIEVGLLWLGLTVAFEFLFGHYVAKQAWSQLLGDYNILAGRVWIVIPIWITIAPLLFYQLLE
jgi:hypothetical protein